MEALTIIVGIYLCLLGYHAILKIGCWMCGVEFDHRHGPMFP